MPRVSEAARVTVSGNVDVESLEVWTELRRAAKAQGDTVLRNGQLMENGVAFRGSVTSTIYRVVPRLTQMQRESAELVCKAIHSYLRATGNAAFVGNNVWWISREWKPSGRMVDEPDHRAKKEARLTPKEAGEDREPAKVVVIHAAKPAELQDAPSVLLQSHDRVLEILRAHKDQPLAATEIAFVLDDLKYPPEDQSARPIAATQPTAGGATIGALRKLVDAGKVFRRLETTPERRVRAGLAPDESPGGRPGYLFSTVNPPPLRTQREVVKGFTLEVTALPRDASVIRGSRMRSDRNERVLNALIAAERPVTVLELAEAADIGRSSIEDALRDLKAAGLAHHGPFRREGRRWLPIDKQFSLALVEEPAPTPTPSPSKEDTPMLDSDRAIVRAVKDAGKPLTCVEIATATGFSTSKIYHSINNHHKLEQVGSRHRERLYWLTGKPIPTPTPEETPVTSNGARYMSHAGSLPETKPATEQRDTQAEQSTSAVPDADKIAAALRAKGQARVAELEAENARLKAENAELQAVVQQFRELAGLA